MRNKKLYILSYIACFCYFLQIFSADHTSTLKIVLFRGPICCVIIGRDTISNSISVEDAEQLVGIGSNQYYIGSLNFWVYNNETEIPHTLELICTTYDVVNLRYLALNGAAPLVIQVKKNFDSNGNLIPFVVIDSTINPIILRQSNSMMRENHKFQFYILEDPSNTFVDGAYTATFRLYFASP